LIQEKCEKTIGQDDPLTPSIKVLKKTVSLERGVKRLRIKTPPNNERNPKNPRKPPTPTIQAIQWLFSSNSIAEQHPNKPENPAKQQNNPQNNPKPDK
jgi:hypothetical protein